MTPTHVQFEYTCTSTKATSFTFLNAIKCKDFIHFAYQKHLGATILLNSYHNMALTLLEMNSNFTIFVIFI